MLLEYLSYYLFPQWFYMILHFRATDADTGQNAALRYAIIGGNTQGQFSIDSQNGEITLVKPLDYESIRSYRLVIRAQGKQT